MTKSDAEMPEYIAVISTRTGLSPRWIHRCVQVGLVSDAFTEQDLRQLRRIRRLIGLGINLAGVEVILHMREQILRLQGELSQREGG